VNQTVATYTPKTLITSKTLGNGSANVATAQYQNTGTGETVARSLTSTGQAGATGQVTWEMGVTGATSIQQQRFIDAYVLTANISYFVNGWYTVPVSSFLSAWGSTATVTGYAAGVLSV
jgi:hypothetical protein